METKDKPEVVKETLTLEGKSAKLANELSDFTGTHYYYRHGMVRTFLFTDGVKHFADNAGNGAYWLLDILATEPSITKSVKENYLIFAKLRVKRRDETSGSCVGDLIVYQDTAEEGEEFVGVCYQRHLDFTDCPPGEWDFYLGFNEMEGRPCVIACLPMEN